VDTDDEEEDGEDGEYHGASGPAASRSWMSHLFLFLPAAGAAALRLLQVREKSATPALVVRRKAAPPLRAHLGVLLPPPARA
jgi:hypothetical protein